MKIHVIGTGYVGLVTALAFSNYGHTIKCWDVQDSVIEKLKAGKIHFYEPKCEELLAKAISKNAISFDHIKNFHIESEDELIFVCVGTPTIGESIDLQYVINAAKIIGNKLSKVANPSIIIKSTVVPGTTLDTVLYHIKDSLKEKSIEINLGMAPEFLREGSALEDCLEPDRVVIGVNNQITENRIRKAYAPFNSNIIVTSISTAEFSKYANNVILALFVSISNELSRIAHLRDDINIDTALKIVGYDKRWRINGELPPIFRYMYPGCGFGGSCFPKDVKALENYSSALGQYTPMLSSIISTNNTQPVECLNVIKDWLAKAKNIGVLGLSFKPFTDDIRESPSITIVNKLSETHNILIHDPEVTYSSYEEVLINPADVTYEPNLAKLLSQIDTIILVTPWPEYLNIHKFQSIYQNISIYDCRSALDDSQFTQWSYRSYTQKEMKFE